MCSNIRQTPLTAGYIILLKLPLVGLKSLGRAQINPSLYNPLPTTQNSSAAATQSEWKQYKYKVRFNVQKHDINLNYSIFSFHLIPQQTVSRF